MKATILVNRRKVASRVVGVIASPVALVRATRLRRPPDLFELRLDALRDSLGEVERMIPQLRAPLILTARHPAEGGVRQSSSIRFRKARHATPPSLCFACVFINRSTLRRHHEHPFRVRAGK